MISEQHLVERIERLQIDVLRRWVDLGLVEPHGDASNHQFDDVDEARVALACDLHYGMGCDHESLPVILSLLDQLHQTRHSLRAITRAVSEQPHEVRVAVTVRTRVMLGGEPEDGSMPKADT